MSSNYNSLDDYPFRPIREAPSSIDRSSAEAVQRDAQTLEPGETLRPAQEVSMNWPGQATVVNPSGETVYSGPLDPNARFSVEETGRFDVRRGGETVGTFEVESGDGNTGEETVGSPGDFTNVSEPSGPEPEDVAGVVNADNPEGAALAPSLRESVGNVGGDVNVGDETLSVGPVTDADELLNGDGGSGLLGGVGLLAALAAAAWVVFG